MKPVQRKHCDETMSTVLAEHTYARLLVLAPNLDLLDGECLSQPDGRRRLWLRIIEQTPYSTHCRLSEYSGEGRAEVEELVVELRVYHDAHVADMLRYHNRFGGHDVFENRVLDSSGLARKRELNFFVWKWLGHCLAQGHRIAALEQVAP